MRNKTKLFWSFVFCLVMYSSTSFATGPRVAPSLFVANVNQVHAMEFPPFISSSAKDQGLLIELIKRVLKAEKIAGDINVLPSQNMIKYYFSRENALAMIGHDFNLNKSEQKKALFIPVLSTDEYYFSYNSAERAALNWNGKLSSFQDKTYGTNKGASVKKYKAAGIKIKYARLQALLKKMQNQEVDFIREPELTVQTLTEQYMPNEKHLFVRLEPKAGEILLGIVFNAEHPDGRGSAKKFKQGLNKIIANGEFKSILQKHLGDDANILPYIKHLNVK